MSEPYGGADYIHLVEEIEYLERDELAKAVREFAEKHGISLEEAPTEADSSAEGISLEDSDD